MPSSGSQLLQKSVVQPLVLSPRWGRLVQGQMTVIRYTGRRSGRTFTTPVGYKRHGEEMTIGVQFPDQKKWWRNFLDGGGPILRPAPRRRPKRKSHRPARSSRKGHLQHRFGAGLVERCPRPSPEDPGSPYRREWERNRKPGRIGSEDYGGVTQLGGTPPSFPTAPHSLLPTILSQGLRQQSHPT